MRDPTLRTTVTCVVMKYYFAERTLYIFFSLWTIVKMINSSTSNIPRAYKNSVFVKASVCVETGATSHTTSNLRRF